MALAIANTLANGTETNKSSGNTQTFSPTVVSGELVLVAVRSQANSTNMGSITNPPTSSGGETLTRIAVQNFGTNPVLFIDTYWFIAAASGAPTITITYGGAAFTYSNTQWIVDTVIGYDSITPIRQSASAEGSSTNPVVTLGSAPLSTGLTWGAAAINAVAANISVTGGWTQLAEFDTPTETSRAISTLWRSNIQTADWTVSGTSSFCAMAAEINAAITGQRRGGRPVLTSIQRGAFY